MDEKTATRDRILHAAIQRIKHYGYSKTTMAEIAADCGMSPGNIYRFFEAKIDIAEGMARAHYAQQQFELAAIARRKDLSVVERLRALLFKHMRDTYELFESNDKILEVGQVIQRERPLFFNEELAQERVYLAALLEEGADSGLFAKRDDYNLLAETIQCATAKFMAAQLFSQLPLAKLERELTMVLDLLLTGLLSRPDQMTKA